MEELVAAGLSPLVGRTRELGELERGLDAARFVTVAGPGGVGKTRLALAMLQRRAEAAYLVELAALEDPELVLPAAMTAAGVVVEAGVDPLGSLAARLREGPAVLLLDNCEHLPAAVVELATPLMAACPALRVLATSRSPLGVPGEVVFAVPPLSLGAGGDAIALFVDRARRASRDFEPAGEDLAAIARLCEELDGLPLAIELAAARVRAFGVPEIAGDLGRRLDMLGGGSGSGRHASIRASLDWSCALLSEPERALLARLSVFAGGWDLDAAEAVCAGDPVPPRQTIDLLTRLVDRSLVVSRRQEGRARFGMLATVAEYAREQLAARGERQPAGTSHAAWYGQLVERAHAALTGGDQAAALAELDREQANIRAALGWGQAHGGHAVIRFASCMAPYWHARGRFEEGRATLESLRAKADRAPLAVRAPFLWALGLMLVCAGRLEQAGPVVGQALDRARRAREPRLVARALNLTAELSLMGDPPAAVAPLEEAAALARDTADDWCLADALGKLGAAAVYRGEARAAGEALRECVAIARRNGDQRTLHRALGGLARVALLEGDHRAGVRLLEEGLNISRKLRDRSWIALDLAMLGEHLRALGEHDEARVRIAEGLALAQEIGAAYPVYVATGLLGRASLAAGERARAIDLFTSALELGERAGLAPFRAWWHQGLGEAALAAGDIETARSQFRSAIASASEVGNRRDAARATAGLGAVALAHGEAEVASQQLRDAAALAWDAGDRAAARSTLELLVEASARAGRTDRANQIADKLEAGELDQAVALALRGHGRRSAEPHPGWEGLTRAEAEVAELAAAGLNNPEIAQRLFMSRSTVKVHLSRAYAKLGVANRTELAAVARPRAGGAS